MPTILMLEKIIIRVLEKSLHFLFQLLYEPCSSSFSPSSPLLILSFNKIHSKVIRQTGQLS